MSENNQLKETKTQLTKSLEDAKRDLQNVRSSNTSAQQTEIELLRVRSSPCLCAHRGCRVQKKLAEAEAAKIEAQKDLTVKVGLSCGRSLNNIRVSVERVAAVQGAEENGS